MPDKTMLKNLAKKTVIPVAAALITGGGVQLANNASIPASEPALFHHYTPPHGGAYLSPQLDTALHALRDAARTARMFAEVDVGRYEGIVKGFKVQRGDLSQRRNANGLTLPDVNYLDERVGQLNQALAQSERALRTGQRIMAMADSVEESVAQARRGPPSSRPAKQQSNPGEQ